MQGERMRLALEVREQIFRLFVGRQMIGLSSCLSRYKTD